MAPRPEPPTRNILSLCAGVGGLELGIQLALSHIGEIGRGVCYVEREAAAAASLVASMEAGWFHPAPIWSDMLTFDAKPWRGRVHILASGDPCQDNSVAGQRAGAGGKRFLAPEVCRIAEECRPDLIFRENVPGNADGQLEAIVPTLERLGYRVAAGIFSSSETGNTMRRERLFIMAERESGARWLRGTEGWITDANAGGCGSDMARPVGHLEARREPASGEAAGGRSLGQSGGSGRALGQPISGSDRSLAPDTQRGSLERTAADGSGNGREQAVDRPIGQRSPTGRSDNPGNERNQPCAASEHCSAELASTSSAGPQGQQRGQQRGQHVPARRQVKGGLAGLCSGTVLPPAVIPGPTDSRWRALLDRFPEYQPALSKEEAESHLRRGIDALAHRTERLRATGNGVDPVVAAYAFLSLRALLDADRASAAGPFLMASA